MQSPPGQQQPRRSPPRSRWSDRFSAAAIATCLHVLALIAVVLSAPTVLQQPPQPDEPPQEAIQVELTTLPAPRPELAPAPVPPAPRLKPEETPEPKVAPVQTTPAPTHEIVNPRPPRPEIPKLTAQPVRPEPKPLPPRPEPPRPEPPRPEPPRPTLPKPIPAPVQPEPKPEPPRLVPLQTVRPVTAPTARTDDKQKDREKELLRAREAELLRPSPVLAPPSAPAAPAASGVAGSSQAAAARASGGAPASGPPSPNFRLPPGFGRVQDDTGGGLRGVLRSTVGCEHQDYAHLSAAEKERCAGAFLRDAAHGPAVDRVPAAKREAYDQEAAANERRRLQKEGGLASPVVSCDGPGSNLGGGCLPDEAHKKIRPK